MRLSSFTFEIINIINITLIILNFLPFNLNLFIYITYLIKVFNYFKTIKLTNNLLYKLLIITI